MVEKSSSSPASRRGVEGKQSVSPASEIGLEDVASVPPRRGGGGGGRVRPDSGGAAAAAAAKAAELARQKEIQRKARLQKEAQAAQKAKEQKRRNIIVRQAGIDFRRKARELNLSRKRGEISKEDFKKKFKDLIGGRVKQQRTFKAIQGLLTSKAERDTLRKEVGKFEKAQGSKLSNAQLRTLLEGKEVVGIVRPFVGPRLPDRPRSKLVPFVKPRPVQGLIIRAGSLISKIVQEGRELGKNKKEIDKKISDQLKRLGATDNNIDRALNRTDFTKFTFPGLIASRLGGDNIFKEVRGGLIKGVRDEPTTAVLSFGVGKALPSITKFLGSSKGIKKVSKLVPKTVKKIGRKVVPKALITSYLASSGLQVAKAEKGKRVATVSKIIATEAIPFNLGVKSGVRGLLRGELQTEIKRALAKLPKRKQDAFKELIKKAELLETTKIDLRDVDLKRLKRIPDKAKPEILKFLKQEDVVIGGSLGQQTAVTVKRNLAQSDLDLYTERDPIKLAKDLTKKLQNLGIERVVRTGKEVRIAGKKAAEFQKMDRLIANIESVIPAWRSPTSFIVRTKSGIRVPKITVQLKRKLVGGFTDPKRAKRTDFKDLKDAKDILDKLFKKAELQARRKFFFKEKNIKALEERFGVSISRKVPTKKPPTKIPSRKTPTIKKPTLKKIPPKKVPPTRKPLALKRDAKGQFVKRTKPSQAPRKKPKPSQPTVRRRPKPSPPSQPPRKDRPSQPPVRIPPGTPPTKIRGPPPPDRDRPSQPPVKPPRKKPPTKIPPTEPPPKKPPKRKPPKLVKLTRAKKKLLGPGFKQSFNIFGKSGKRLIKLNKKPLSRKDALDRGSFAIDNTVSRTMKLVPVGRVKKFLGTIKRKEKGHFQKHRKNLRNFRIVKGKKKPLKNKFIERTRAAISTRGEKKQLSLAKFAKEQGFGTRKVSTKTLKRNTRGRFVKRRK